MKTTILPNGTTWSQGQLVAHQFSNLEYNKKLGLLLLPVDHQLLDEDGNRWFLGLFHDTIAKPSTLLDKSFKSRACRIDGQKIDKRDNGIGTIRVRTIELVE